MSKRNFASALVGIGLVVLCAFVVHRISHTAVAEDAAPHLAAPSSHAQIAALARRFGAHPARGTIRGASQATCASGQCSRGTFSTYTLNGVANGDGTASTRTYLVYRPGGLTPSNTNRAPAVFTFYASGNCGFHPNRFSTLAPSGRFIVVFMEVPCARNNNWEKKNVDSAAATRPNDESYVAAVVQAITQCPSSGAGLNQCADPARLYAAGISSGGNMTADIMCDTQNSILFRGYMIDSSSLSLNHGSPNCPSTNRSFFVMMAAGNYGADRLLYNNITPHPHLDVPAFADWAAGQLGCPGPRIDDAIGSPVQSTLRYSYAGPCAYAQAGSLAVETLGIIDGAHAWGCQDSDAGASPNGCPGMPTPPGLSPAGLPKTNGLFVEGEFWNFVASGVSSATPAPPLVRSTGSHSTADGYVALGDGFASGDGNAPFAAGTDTPRDRCHRSLFAYPLEADALGGGQLALSLHPCASARVSSFYHATPRNHEPAQLHWLSGTVRAVTLSVGWNDASLPAALQSCVVDSAHCQVKWHARVDSAIKAMAARSRHSQRSLYALDKTIASDTRPATVIAVGYPRIFPGAVPSQCRTGVRGLNFTRSAMVWINSEIQKLDAAIGGAAAAAHIKYVQSSYRALAGHEWCTRQPDLNGPGRQASAAARRSASLLGGKFTPSRTGQLALAKLLAKML